MGKNFNWKVSLIVLLIIVFGWTLYPPQKTLKPGIDLAGGTSLIYEIDAQGLDSNQKRDLSNRMITILRRRVDPANIQNLVWRPQGNTRFEIQMPLASKEARQKRKAYEDTLAEVLEQNINPAVVMRALNDPNQQREKEIERLASGSQKRKEILENLVQQYDKLRQLRAERDKLKKQIENIETNIEETPVKISDIQTHIGQLPADKYDNLKQIITETLDPNLPAEQTELAVKYAQTYADWANVVNKLTESETGQNAVYRQSIRRLDNLNLTEDQLKYVLQIPQDSSKRREEIEKLKEQFPLRAEQIDKVIAAYDQYRPFRGRLDDPKDLQRMLKGAGILEFRILPTYSESELNAEEINAYITALKEKGPKYASDSDYVWCKIEDPENWNSQNTIVGQFGEKFYVLASNNPEDTMLHSSKEEWKLTSARPTQDRQGRRAISFSLDQHGGMKFGRITHNNIGKPLCILLDGMAVSAPNINSRITTQGIITGSFTRTEQTDMVNKLNAGSLPARLIEQPISVKTIGPSIGAENRDKGIKAGFAGLILVLVFMLIYYVMAGGVADIALTLNVLFILGTMAFLRATFTLPGIAGLILTIGMSVDANVLIFERIREEQQKGSSLNIAIKNGYQKAFRAIFDANLTTFITAAILLWVASEEIKGFAIVLMIGILSSMFTALFVTRVIFDMLTAKRILKNHLFMLQIIHKPNINWMKIRPLFFTVSIILIAAGMFVFFTRDEQADSKYDIEFTGGTSVQINLKTPLTRNEVAERIHQTGKDLGSSALAAANVYSIGKSQNQYEIATTATNQTTAVINIADSNATADKIKNNLTGTVLTNLQVKPTATAGTFRITTSQPNKSVVKEILTERLGNAEISKIESDEIVNNAILQTFGEELEIQRNLQPEFVSTKKIDETLIAEYPSLTEYVGGIAITFKTGISATAEEIDKRLKDLRFKPDTRDMQWYSYKILDDKLETISPEKEVNKFTYISVNPEANFRDVSEQQWEMFKNNEIKKVQSATQLETSLPRVTQINPSVGSEAKNRAIVAIILSLFAIVTYIWVRFGNVRYGFAAILALVHDVCITLGAVTACTYIASSSIGQALLIENFKIDLTMIAAFLTLIGYSLNDTIVVFDRIRENRKKAQLTAATISESINQNLSRTLLTSLTTFLVILTMYIFGGKALRGFTFAIGLGIIIGTYSSIAIAAPTLLLGKGKSENKD
jgi:SecD/SecF fusion protein